MILLELFSGIGGFALGLERAGLKFRKVFFSEVDKHAIANYKYNFKDAEYIGSVRNVRRIIGIIRAKQLPGERIIITFGSPCQDFSLAGKRSGLDGNKSSLIKYALFLIRWLKPDVYIWENVKGAYSTNAGADFWAICQAFANIDGYGLEQQLLNTAWFLPQNRERIYLVGHARGRSKPGVFPIGEADKLYNKSSKNKETTHSIASTLMSEAYNKNTGNYLLQVKSNTKQGFEIAEEGDSINISVTNSETRRVSKVKAQTIDTAANKCVVVQPILTPDRLEKRQNGRRFKEDGEPAFTLNCQDQHGIMINNSHIRRLTEIECERLQGFPDDWTKWGVYEEIDYKILRMQRKLRKALKKQNTPIDFTEFDERKKVVKEISKTQRYKMCGNAVSVCMPEIIGSRLKFINE